MGRSIAEQQARTAGTWWGKRNPWLRWVMVLTVCMGGLLVLDRLLRPHDPMQNVALVAFLAGAAAAAVVVRPLGHLPYVARNLHAGPYLDTFLVCAIGSWLSVRFLLGTFGYPQVGNGGLHIAHMLWGGALMLTGIVISLTCLGRYGQMVVAIITGLGFGLFIDELGKFITSNNDYFYQPTLAILYSIFLALYLVFRLLTRYRQATEREELANVVDWVREALIRGNDPDAVDRARYYLEQVSTRSAVTESLEQLLDTIRVWPPRALSCRQRLKRSVRRLYYHLVGSRWFERTAVGLFLLLVALEMLTNIGETQSLMRVGPTYRLPGSHLVLTLYNASGLIIENVAGAIGDILLVSGVVLMFWSRTTAYRLWKAGVVIIMLFEGFFGLYYAQFLALPTLTVDVLALSMVNSLLAGDRQRRLIAIDNVEAPTRILRASSGK